LRCCGFRSIQRASMEARGRAGPSPAQFGLLLGSVRTLRAGLPQRGTLMNRQALLRGAAALLLASALVSCGEMQRPVQPTTEITRTQAHPTDFQVIDGAWVMQGQAVVVLRQGYSAGDLLNRYHISQLGQIVIDQTTYLLVGGTQIETFKLVEELRSDFAVESSDYNYGLAAPEYEGTPMSFDDHHGQLTSAD